MLLGYEIAHEELERSEAALTPPAENAGTPVRRFEKNACWVLAQLERETENRARTGNCSPVGGVVSCF